MPTYGPGQCCKTAKGVNPGFTLFTDSEVRHVCCDYVMHYSSVSVCKRGKVGVSETQKSKVRAKFM